MVRLNLCPVLYKGVSVRKIVQIALSSASSGALSLCALCEDGTLWMKFVVDAGESDWVQVPEIPQDVEAPQDWDGVTGDCLPVPKE